MGEINEKIVKYDSVPKFKILWKIGILIVILAVFGIVMKVVLFPLWFVGTVADSGKKIIEKTIDADNVINNYEWFKQTHENIIAIDGKITNAEMDLSNFNAAAGPRKEWTFEDKNEFSRLMSVATGLRNHREDVKSKYNARSKMLNRKLFKDKNLPHQIK